MNKTGNTYEFEGAKIGVGKDQVIEVLKGAPELYQKVYTATKVAVKKEGNDK